MSEFEKVMVVSNRGSLDTACTSNVSPGLMLRWWAFLVELDWTLRLLQILRRSHGSLPRAVGAELESTDEVVAVDRPKHIHIYNTITKRVLFNPKQQYHETCVYLYLINQKKTPRVNHFKIWFWSDILQVHRSTSNKMDLSPDIDPTEISRIFHQLP